jgi:hypothetical protein
LLPLRHFLCIARLPEARGSTVTRASRGGRRR